MIKIKSLKPDELGDIVCSIFNEELKISVKFDYLVTPEDILFRFVFEDKTYKDYYFEDMIQRFKTVDFLVANLLAILKARKLKKRA